MIRIAVIALAGMGGLYLVLLLLIYSFQRNLMYFPDQAVSSDAVLSAAGFERISIDSDDFEPLVSLWQPPSAPEKPVILHFHGNAGSVFHRIPLYQQMAADGAGVLAVGYPGYGGNGGEISEGNFHQTARANYDWLIEHGIEPKRIIIAGQSIGSGSATRLAAEKDAAGMILEAPFTGTDDIAARQFPYFPVRLLMKDSFRNVDLIAGIDMPLVWIHGTADEVISFEIGQLLFDRAEQPKTAFPIKNGGHNDLWDRGIGKIIRDEAARLSRE
ncbi:alpha/beta hydrolase [Parasphingorhabdus sp.]|uniref:alpha/beta hydrolase n=1 Tax=Parasphingorhabdus sp. TaxID=2709688 RepID=UPI003265ADBF